METTLSKKNVAIYIYVYTYLKRLPSKMRKISLLQSHDEYIYRKTQLHYHD